jgi:tetratricopeptide (TPR) repeat protein
MDDPDKAVFLSYASQDGEAARHICNALRAAGIEVWFDQSELRGGEAWDIAIRKQIKSCALFLPVISAHTNGRTEGYFRLEWKLAIDRSYLMASSKVFLLPIVIDESRDGDANVPDRFREVQWISLARGVPTPDFVERVARLVSRAALPENVLQKEIQTDPVADRRSAGPRLKVSLHRKVWMLVFLLAVLAGAAWVFQQRLAAPVAMVPYSTEDRRMTFALLPLQPNEDDPEASQIAKATGKKAYASLEMNRNWVNLALGASVDRALAQTSVPKEVARATNVHFLIRGTVSRAASGHTVTLSSVDGETERVLGSVDLSVPPNSLTPHWDDEIDDATGLLVSYGLQVEVEKARNKPYAALDVRDLAFRAWIDWGRGRQSKDEKGAYIEASALLNRALELAPDDPLSLWETAILNLCDCVNGWSQNVAEQQAIGEAAVDRYLQMYPKSVGMLRRKAELFQLRGHYAESLDVLDNALRIKPDYYDAMQDKAYALLKLGRAQEAAAVAVVVYERDSDSAGITGLMAAIDYVLRDYANAERLARKSITQLRNIELSTSKIGAVRLTFIAAAGQLHDTEAAAVGIADLRESVPDLKSLTSIHKWIHPQADLYGYASLFDGLRLAGLPE